MRHKCLHWICRTSTGMFGIVSAAILFLKFFKTGHEASGFLLLGLMFLLWLISRKYPEEATSRIASRFTLRAIVPFVAGVEVSFYLLIPAALAIGYECWFAVLKLNEENPEQKHPRAAPAIAVPVPPLPLRPVVRLTAEELIQLPPAESSKDEPNEGDKVIGQCSPMGSDLFVVSFGCFETPPVNLASSDLCISLDVSSLRTTDVLLWLPSEVTGVPSGARIRWELRDKSRVIVPACDDPKTIFGRATMEISGKYLV